MNNREEQAKAIMSQDSGLQLIQAAAKVPAGLYVVAISGGVDSMVLLDVLVQLPHLQLVVAHVDHGIRPDASKDYRLVQETARRHGLLFYGLRVCLGQQASEALAREVRYAFLFSVLRRVNATAIITAHHADDLLETVAIQVLRGSGRLGLSPLNRESIIRPFLGITKSQIKTHAQNRAIEWREDSTNSNLAYTRNRIRASHLLSPAASLQAKRHAVLRLMQQTDALNQCIAGDLQMVLDWIFTDSCTIDRVRFALLPHVVAKELMAEILRTYKIPFSAPLIEKLVVALKVQKANTWLDVSGSARFKIDKKTAKLLVQ